MNNPKSNSEFMNVLGGVESDCFARFRQKMIDGLFLLSQNAEKLLVLVQMIGTAQSDLPCFANGGVDVAVQELS